MKDLIKYDIFLSHNGKDKLWTEKLAYDIENNNEGEPLKVFFDKWDIAKGADIPKEISDGLQFSRFIGLVLSPDSVGSEWVSLELSSSIMNDPSAKMKSIIPLYKKTCEVPFVLKRINYIDFRNELNYNDALAELISVLRNKTIKRGSNNYENIFLREDILKFEDNLIMFQRPAFRMPCVDEISFQELTNAVDDTQSAINTGILTNRYGNKLSKINSINDFQTNKYKQKLETITHLLQTLKKSLICLNQLLFDENYRGNFFTYDGFWKFKIETPKEYIKMVITLLLMDIIDSQRNQILTEANELIENENKKINLISYSSKVIFNQQEGQYLGNLKRMFKHSELETLQQINIKGLFEIYPSILHLIMDNRFEHIYTLLFSRQIKTFS